MDALASVKAPTQEYKEVAKQIADTEKKQAALNDRMTKFLELGGKTNSKQYKSMQYDAAELKNTIAYAKGELQDLVDTGKAFTLGNSTAEFNDLSRQLSEEQARLNKLTAQYQNAQNNLSAARQAQESAENFRRMGAAADKAFSTTKKGAISAEKALGILSVGVKNITAFAGKAVLGLSGLKGISKTSEGAIGHLGKRMFSLAKTVFVFGILRRALTAFKDGVQEGFGTYLNYDSSLKAAIAGLRVQLNALKGSLASAFAPIISVIVPYLSTLISWVTTAANAVAAFIATLMGKSSYKKAVAGVGAVGAAADDTAGSLNDATEAAEELEKALGHYDELNVIDQSDSSSGSGSGGSGGSGGSAGDITYEDVEISSAISDFAEKVKEAWANSDFTEIGGIIGQKLNDALESIPWDGIQATARKIGKSVATLINGFVETSELGDMVGETIAEAINTGLLGVESFTGNLHFASVGRFVADGINGALTTLKWDSLTTVADNIGGGLADALNSIMTVETFSNIGQSFAKAINSVISGAYTFVTTSQWSGWGTAIASSVNNFFSTFDWEKAGLTFSDAVKGIINTLTTAIQKTSWSSVGNNIGSMLRRIDWTGILSAVGTLIWEAIKASIETWKDSFDAAPVETTIVTVLLGMKFTGLGHFIGKKIWDLIQAQFVGEEAVAAASTAATGLSTTLSSAITTALTGTAIVGAIAAGVAFIYKGVSDMLSDPDFLKNKDIEQYIKDNPGALGDGAETPEIEIKITGDNEPLKESVTESAEILNRDLPNETSVDMKANQTPSFTSARDAWNIIKDKTATIFAKVNDQSGGKFSDLQSKWNTIKDKTAKLTTKLSNKIKESTMKVLSNGWGKIKSKSAKLSTSVSGVSKDTISRYGSAWDKIKSRKATLTFAIASSIGTFALKTLLGLKDGGIYSGSMWKTLPQKAEGGIFQSNFWKSIPKYATGGSPHGTMFVAGEAGPEVVGHVGGRTEVLNKSQIASAIASAISGVMNTALNDLGTAVLSHMTECTNMVITNMGSIMDTIYSAANYSTTQQVQFAGIPAGYMPDTNRTNTVYSPGYSGGMQIDYDKLAGAVANRISGSIEIPINMALDGNIVYRDMVRIDRATMKQTGKSGFGG